MPAPKQSNDLKRQKQITAEIKKQQEVMAAHNKTSKSYQQAEEKILKLKRKQENVSKRIVKEEERRESQSKDLGAQLNRNVRLQKDFTNIGKQAVIGAVDFEKRQKAIGKLINTDLDQRTDLSSILIDQVSTANDINDSQLKIGTTLFDTTDTVKKLGEQQSSIEQKRLDIMTGRISLSEKERKVALAVLDTAEKEVKVQKDIVKFQQLQHDATQNLGKGMEDIKGQAMAFGAQLKSIAMNPVMAIGAGLLLAGKYLYDMFKGAMELKSELGISDEAAAGLQMQITDTAAAFKMAGVEAGDVKDAALGLMDNFGGINAVTPELLGGMAKMKAELGVSGTNAANLMVAMKATGAASEEAAFKMAETVGHLAQAEGVAPGQVMQDLAQNTDAFAQFAKDGGMNVAKAAIQAKKLGINFDTSVKIADNLLNFESSIQSQMEAEILLGKQLNLDKARSMALSGDMEGMQKEILKNVGSEAEFNQMNVLQRRALATSMGISVIELSKMVANQSNLNKRTKSQVATANLTAGVMKLIRDLGQDLLEVWKVLKPILMVALVPIGIAVFAVVKLISGLASVITYMNQFGNIGTWILGIFTSMWLLSKLTGKTQILDAIKLGAIKTAQFLKEKLHLGGVVDAGKNLAGAAAKRGKELVGGVTGKLKGKMKMPKLPDKTPGGGSNPLGFVEKIDPKKVLAGAAAMLIVAAALWVTAKALQEFGSVEWSSLAKAGVALLGLVLVLVAIGALMMSGVGALAIIAGAAAMLLIAAALLVLGHAIQAIGTGFGMLAEGLTSFSPLLSTLVPLASGIIILAGAFGILGMGMGLLAIGALALLPALPVLMALGSIGMLGMALAGGGEESVTETNMVSSGGGEESVTETESTINTTDMTDTNVKLDGVISAVTALQESNKQLLTSLTGKVKGLAEA